MKVLIEYYDKDVLKNIVAPLTLRPDKVVYLYDRGMRDGNVFRSLRTCFQKSMPQIEVDSISTDIGSVERLRQITRRVIEQYGAENCTLELTGGSELMMIAGYKAGRETGALMVHTDLIYRRINNVETDEKIADTVTLTLENFLDARGAELMGESHRPPQPQRYDAINKMARFLFRNLKEWKWTCSWIQTVASRGLPHELTMDSPKIVTQKNGREVQAGEEILREFEKNGFIEELRLTEKKVHFRFCSIEDKQYGISYGVWLELYVYVAAASSGVFDDVKLGTMIDWDIYDGTRMGGNEIDVVLMEESLPVFISCKLREADTAALNELLIGKKRLGGWFSKGLIVTFSREKQEKTGTYERCRELGLEMLDERDILAADFRERLVQAIQGHDLMSLKWKKV